MKNFKLSLSFVFATLLVFSGWSSQAQSLFGPKFRAYIFSAPEKHLSGVRKIAIVNFENKSSYSAKASGTDIGTKMNDYLTEQLIKEFRGVKDKNALHMKGARTNVFELVERSRLDQVMKEQRLAVSGAIDESQAVEVGKLLGVDAIIVGSISYTHKDEKKTVRKQNSKTKKYYTVYTYKRVVTTEVRMKIVSVETAQVLGTISPRTASQDYKESKTPIRGQAVAPTEQLADNCLRQLAPRLANYFSPTFIYQAFDIEKIKVKAYKKRAREAREYLKRGEIEKAFPIYKAIYEEDSYNPKVAYNVGAIYEVIGDFDKAYEAYSIAHELEPDDKWYFKSYKRAKNGKQMAEDLKTIGIEITPKTLKEGGEGVLAKKVETRGSRSKRVMVYEEPNKNSKVIAKVPGGIKLKVIDQAEGWFYVELIGKKQGYINEDDVSEE